MIVKKRAQGPRHLVIPDTQIREDVPTEHIAWAARYAADKRPDSIIQIGDWGDYTSLNKYDAGKKSSHGRTYKSDVEADNKARKLFETELHRHAPRSYKPKKKHGRGNHEQRIWTALEEDPKADYSFDHIDWKKYGWEVHEFLDPFVVDGITYIHYCCLNDQGQVTQSKNGAPSAAAQARRMMTSTVCGHKQGLDIAFRYSPGRTVLSVIAGSFYQHEERYLTGQGTNYWRGVVVLNDVRDGWAEPMPVSLDYLRRRYG